MRKYLKIGLIEIGIKPALAFELCDATHHFVVCKKWKHNFRERLVMMLKKTLVGTLLLGSLSANAVPLDNSFHGAPLNLPDGYNNYDLSQDAQDKHIYYLAPNKGRLVINNGMPAISYATAMRNGNNFGVMNTVFQFNIDPQAFNAIKSHLRAQDPNAKLKQLPFAQSKPSLAVAGLGNGEKSCTTVLDIIENKEMEQCINLVYRSVIASNGPTLGEELSTSVVLTPAGVDILPQLMAGGAGMVVNLEGIYRAALPAFKAKIKADYKKLYESYAWYAGYHDGVCTDIAISDFFEKEVACTASGLSGNGGPCSIKVTYTDSLGNPINNIFDSLPSDAESEETKEWHKLHAKRVEVLWTSIDGLVEDFKEKFLEPVVGRKAEVDKSKTLGYAFRADRNRTEQMGSYEFERDMIQSVGPKKKIITGYTVCLKLNGTTGTISKELSGSCSNYWGGSSNEESLLPVVEQFNEPSNANATPTAEKIEWDE